ncbi:MAG TPA: bifunctional phosphopantothenoylcysteine decarboxylase/phosphopantothenate--cysteine ligase CoaBC [Thiolapillus brandeum]|uniref:Coenzyme A biosynthesis bifunctional protein CoaBC n=1 Tax=Thiolapillus brandeum TaxID=1076588 RepID=A0A831RVG3_9GAMM|nr:bifunctional phosphopantothenoylcysteine decarboxylase/phosphopantothenate--cysteine ligase CoaBC [Thiolapillus brandeum]
MAGVANQNILLGVTGGIAAYKSVELARLLLKAGARVRVVMTEAATRFVSPLTFQAVTGSPVRCSLFDEEHEAAMGHIELARWADQMVIAPASADFMARMALGLANDLLTTLCLASASSIAIAPAMNQRMWQHPAVQHNLSLLEERGVRVLGPESGEQACGDTGPGRMLEPADMLAALDSASGAGLFAGKKVLITAGPTHEAIDPVRFIGNRSSGKMGYALARAFRRGGADVLLVSGPVSLPAPPGVNRVNVQTALQMHKAVFENIHSVDIFVGCAAVADYRPENPQQQKIKKLSDRMDISLVRNPDILAEVATLEEGPYTLGFAAETQNLVENARAKLLAKQVDMLAANSVADGMGFESDENTLLVIWPEGEKHLPVQDKQQLAESLLGVLADQYRRDE